MYNLNIRFNFFSENIPPKQFFKGGSNWDMPFTAFLLRKRKVGKLFLYFSLLFFAKRKVTKRNGRGLIAKQPQHPARLKRIN
jgi:hypothetical protein